MATRNTKSTSAPVAKLASAVLQDRNASDLAKSLAGSAVAQAAGNKQTGANMEAIAARALNDGRTSSTTKQLAATVVSQSNRER